MNNLLKILIIAGVSLFLTGCRSMRLPVEQPMASELPTAPSVDPTVAIHYPVNKGLDIAITFENARTCDAVQLGLLMMAHLEGLEKVPGYDDPSFFPRYFAMINTDIEESLLYISEKEATMFARAAYLGYQKSVTKADYLEDIREPRILEDIIREENANDVTN